jgi:hypothetical protein
LCNFATKFVLKSAASAAASLWHILLYKHQEVFNSFFVLLIVLIIKAQ